MAVAGYNERSWAIDLIGYLKGIAHNEVRTVRDVSGEQTITDLSGSLFPDVLLVLFIAGTFLLKLSPDIMPVWQTLQKRLGIKKGD